MVSTWMQVLLRIVAVAGLCAAAAGCVSDMTAPAADGSAGQMRYYGGPKSPMWQSQ